MLFDETHVGGNSFSCACLQNDFTVDTDANEISDNHILEEVISEDRQFPNRESSIQNSVRYIRSHHSLTKVRTSLKNDYTHNNVFFFFRITRYRIKFQTFEHTRYVWYFF